MNLIAVDIGNTNIKFALFLDGEQKSIETLCGNDDAKITQIIESYWQRVPILKSSRHHKRDGCLVVCTVKPQWTEKIAQIARQKLDEKIYIIGKDIRYPMDLSVKEPEKTGSDRIVSAAAAYAVTENAVVVIDIGTAITIDIVDQRGVFLGGCILPGFELSSSALNQGAALLPKVPVEKPELPFGRNTAEAIKCGLYYGTVGAIEEIIRRYAEKIAYWPQTVITGSGARIIKEDCRFVDSYVPDLVVKGIALAYQKYVETKE